MNETIPPFLDMLIAYPGWEVCFSMKMHWIYWGRLYDSKFQAGCLAKRMEEDWWIYGYDCPHKVEVFRSKKGRYGVRYIV